MKKLFIFFTYIHTLCASGFDTEMLPKLDAYNALARHAIAHGAGVDFVVDPHFQVVVRYCQKHHSGVLEGIRSSTSDTIPGAMHFGVLIQELLHNKSADIIRGEATALAINPQVRLMYTTIALQAQRKGISVHPLGSFPSSSQPSPSDYLQHFGFPSPKSWEEYPQCLAAFNAIPYDAAELRLFSLEEIRAYEAPSAPRLLSFARIQTRLLKGITPY